MGGVFFFGGGIGIFLAREGVPDAQGQDASFCAFSWPKSLRQEGVMAAPKEVALGTILIVAPRRGKLSKSFAFVKPMRIESTCLQKDVFAMRKDAVC